MLDLFEDQTNLLIFKNSSFEKGYLMNKENNRVEIKL